MRGPFAIHGATFGFCAGLGPPNTFSLVRALRSVLRRPSGWRPDEVSPSAGRKALARSNAAEWAIDRGGV